MNWGVYWFMFPACVVISSIAMLSGISGAAMLSPVIILVFPLIGVPSLAPAAAIGMSLFTEFFGFASGVAGYARRCMIDYNMARQMIYVAVPFAAAGALASAYLNPALLKTIYGVMMFGLAGVLVRQSFTHPTSYPAALETSPQAGKREFRADGSTHVCAAGGKEYRYRLSGLGLSRALTAVGGTLSGMLSTGIGEIELPQLVGICRLPLPVAAGTSVLIVTAAVAAGSISHIARLVSSEGLGAVPWNLIVYTVPGALIGGQIGARLQLAKDLARKAMAGGAATMSAQVSSIPTVTPGSSTRQEDVPKALDAWLADSHPGDYVALHAYLAPTTETTTALQAIRVALRHRTRLATTVGYGPRFLHSTGQLHKGGPNTGLFLQLVDEPAQRVPVPETDYSFEALIRAQALGDLLALKQRGRRVLRVNLGKDATHELNRLVGTLHAVHG